MARKLSTAVMEMNLPSPLPLAAGPALRVTEKLRQAGYEAFLAGGCVRDLLRGAVPQDYDVATSARPEEITHLFRRTREVGAQFGVVLVHMQRRWIEVATFRSDGEYRDGRRPERVEFTDAQHDALRRDFTINGMFLDPLSMEVIDYVGGREDLHARLVRAIGDPQLRFAEDHLRLIRAVRFAARLEYEIEPRTRAAMRSLADKLALVAPERVRDELEKMLTHPGRARAFLLLEETGLLPHLWPGAAWSAERIHRAGQLLKNLPTDAGFVASFCALVVGESQSELERIARHLAFSNQHRQGVRWVVAQVPEWPRPAEVSLAQLKRAMANPAWPALVDLLGAVYRTSGEPRLAQTLLDRARRIPRQDVAPAPLVSGQDLLNRGVPQGPAYKKLLDELYEEQLNECFASREMALRALDQKLGGGMQGGE